ncbi:hypothetical protein NMY22_g13525 [Coprinellus aureogranulatus]|nr:hypothetical protein NMY22_g13525 [Coprinellus aureogranulatus]
MSDSTPLAPNGDCSAGFPFARPRRVSPFPTRLGVHSFPSHLYYTTIVVHITHNGQGNVKKPPRDPFKPYDPNNKRRAPLKARVVTEEEAAKNKAEHEERVKQAKAAKEKAEKEKARAEKEARDKWLTGTFDKLKGDEEYGTLFQFMKDIFTTKDQHLSSQVSKMVGNHATELLSFIKDRDGTGKTTTWIKTNFAEVLAREMEQVVEYLRPKRKGEVSEVLEKFSLVNLLLEADILAPNLRELVSELLGHEPGQETKKDKDVVPTTAATVNNAVDSDAESDSSDDECDYGEDNALDKTADMGINDLTVDDDDFPGGEEVVDIVKGVLQRIPDM